MQVGDLSVLSALTSLHTLTLEHVETGELSLSGPAKLNLLYLNDCNIPDVSLSGLTTLASVWGQGGQLGSVSLSGLTGIGVISLTGCQIHDVSLSASEMSHLIWLDLSKNQIQDISALEGLGGLISLDLSCNRISEIGPLAGLTHTHALDLRHNPLNCKACSIVIPQIEANNRHIVICHDACLPCSALTTSSTAGGSVTSPGEGTFEYNDGSVVPVVATASANYHFLNWTGTAVDASKVADPHAAGTTVTMDADYTLQANFVLDTHTLTINVAHGSVTAIPSKPAYDYGETVTLQAAADTGYHFTSWSGDLNGSTNPGTLTMDADKTVTANFALNTYTLTLSSTVGGVAYSPGEGTFQYHYGEQVLLQAKADPLFTFTGWRGDLFTGGEWNLYLLTITRDLAITASFESTADVLYVDDNAPADPGPGDANVSDPNENGTSEHPCDSIQEAIVVAKEGARVIVRPGTYLGPINLMGKNIEISGLHSGDPNITALPVINGQGQGAVIRATNGEGPSCVVSGLVITGGLGRWGGGVLCVGTSPTIVNCLIVGNRSLDPDAGGGIACQDSNATFANCTIAGNYGALQGAGLSFKNSQAVLTNSIVWDNGPVEVVTSGAAQPAIGYSDVAGGWPGVGNRDADPLFVQSGYWADPKDLTKAMPAFDLTAVWVPGDYHLLSQAGRWDPAAGTWVKDAQTSPCIDAGDPNSPVGSEPLPNGNCINLGVYGGTSQASLSGN